MKIMQVSLVQKYLNIWQSTRHLVLLESCSVKYRKHNLAKEPIGYLFRLYMNLVLVVSGIGLFRHLH